jgi:opacity protein-like surface antigen
MQFNFINQDTLVVPDRRWAPFQGRQYGWVLGAGVEKIVAEKLSLRVDYLYSDFGTLKNSYDNGPLVWQDMFHITDKKLALSLNYKF